MFTPEHDRIFTLQHIHVHVHTCSMYICMYLHYMHTHMHVHVHASLAERHRNESLHRIHWCRKTISLIHTYQSVFVYTYSHTLYPYTHTHMYVVNIYIRIYECMCVRVLCELVGFSRIVDLRDPLLLICIAKCTAIRLQHASK